MEFKKNAGSIAKLSKILMLMDTERTGKLVVEDFEACLQKAGLFLSRNEAQALTKRFDVDGDKKVSCVEFLMQMREQLNPRRLAMVGRCFESMDTNGSGVIDSATIKGIFYAKEHPEVIAIKKSESQILSEFLNNFESTTISVTDFQIYYEELSMSIQNDD